MQMVKMSVLTLLLAPVVACGPAPQPPEVSSSSSSLAEEEAPAQSPIDVPEALTPTVSEKFDSPWPTSGFSREELVSTALAKTFPFLEAQQTSYDEAKLQVFIDPSIPASNAEWIDELATATLLTWSADLEQPANLIVGMSNLYMKETVTINKLAMPETSPGQACEYDYGACTSVDTVWVGWGGQGVQSLRQNPGAARMLSHKAFHMVQDSIDWASEGQSRPREFANFRPVWFVEGAAEFYGYTINHYLDLHAYDTEIWTRDYPTLREMEGWDYGNTAYFWGQVANEYIVANVGYEGFIAIYRSLEHGSSFEDAFVAGTGITLDEFYERFDRWANEYIVSD